MTEWTVNHQRAADRVAECMGKTKSIYISNLMQRFRAKWFDALGEDGFNDVLNKMHADGTIELDGKRILALSAVKSEPMKINRPEWWGDVHEKIAERVIKRLNKEEETYITRVMRDISFKGARDIGDSGIESVLEVMSESGLIEINGKKIEKPMVWGGVGATWE